MDHWNKNQYNHNHNHNRFPNYKVKRKYIQNGYNQVLPKEIQELTNKFNSLRK